MGRKSKIPIILSWMEDVHTDSSIYTRRFFSSNEIFNMFEEYYIRKTTKKDITFKGIITTINNIIRDGIYPHFKRRDIHTSSKKQTHYIFLDFTDNLQLDIETIKFSKRQTQYNTYSSKRPFERVTTPLSDLSPSQATPQATCPQATPQATSPQATPLAIPHATCPQATCPNEITPESAYKRQRISYCHQVSIPYPIFPSVIV